MHLHHTSLWLASFLAVACAVAQAPSTPAASDPVAVRAEYNAIVAHLDTGGDLMIVANTDGLMEEMSDALRGLAQLVPARDAAGNNPFAQAIEHVPAFLKSSGLYAVDGFGLSVVPRTDGLHDLKAFAYRDPAAAQLPFWQALVGGAPKRLATLDYLTPDTVLARAGTGDPRQLWKLIVDAKQQWAVEKNKSDADVPTAADLAKYFKGIGMPTCREGGTYSINAVGDSPTCSHAGHALQQ